MLKPKIALIDSDFMSVLLASNNFNQKYEIFDFSSCDTYYNFLTLEKENPFNLLIINIKTKGQLNALHMLDLCKIQQVDCSFIAISDGFTADEALRAHNLGAFKILNTKDNINAVSVAIEQHIYSQYVSYLKSETAEISLKVSENTGFLVKVLNEFISNRELNDYFLKQFPQTKISDYKSYLINLEKDLSYNLKIQEILLRTDTLKEKSSENLVL